jgi:hypothetical protein
MRRIARFLLLTVPLIGIFWMTSWLLSLAMDVPAIKMSYAGIDLWLYILALPFLVFWNLITG